MSYRDDLTAAHARIDALERELRGRGEQDEELTSQIKRLRQQLTAAESRTDLVAAERDRLRAAVTHLEERVAASSPSSGSKQLYVLWEHNRRFRPISGGAPAGVACPTCHAEGLEVEMRHRLGVALETRDAVPEPAFEYAEVCCPRCLYVALKRTT